MDTSILLEEWYDVNKDIEKNYADVLAAESPKRKHIPIGYTWDGVSKFCVPDPEIVHKIVELLAETKWKGTRSLRDAQDQLNVLAESKGLTPVLSAGGMSNILKRMEKKLGIYKGTADSADRLKEHRAKRLLERKAEGRKRPYNRTRANDKIANERKKLTEKNLALQKLKEKEKRLKASAARYAKKLKLKGDPTKYKASDENKTQVDTVSVPKEREVAFAPNPGPQTDFLASDEDIVLYGGAAGGGKSYAMVVDPLRYAHLKNHRAVIVRKTMPELKELVDVARELYELYDPKCKFVGNPTPIFKFSSGAEIMFRFLDRREDMFKFQGIAYTYIGFDELSQQQTAEGFNYVRSRLRSATTTDGSTDGIRCYIRATANPGSLWVYEMFIKDRVPNKRSSSQELRSPPTLQQ